MLLSEGNQSNTTASVWVPAAGWFGMELQEAQDSHTWVLDFSPCSNCTIQIVEGSPCVTEITSYPTPFIHIAHSPQGLTAHLHHHSATPKAHYYAQLGDAVFFFIACCNWELQGTPAIDFWHHNPRDHLNTKGKLNEHPLSLKPQRKHQTSWDAWVMTDVMCRCPR